MTDVWERRLRRAEVLEREWPFAAEFLSFFRRLLEFQRQAHRDFSSVKIADPFDLDVERFIPYILPLLELAGQHGSPVLSEWADLIAEDGPEEWAERFRTYWGAGRFEAPTEGGEFFVPALLQPYLEALRPVGPAASEENPTRCPFCGSRPIASLLREDRTAETVRRTLVCSLCAAEWEFPRVLCPGCREERPEKLPRYTAQEIPWIRVEACDTCRRYLKSVDLTVNADAEPVVDELASTPLDVLARERGYEKIVPNLAGF